MLRNAAVRVVRARIGARALSTTAPVRGDPFPLAMDPDVIKANQARNPEDVVAGWNMPPPLERNGETPDVMRARLIYQTRKRGTLENDLLLSTFARDELPGMNVEEMTEFDKLLDELDWDVYYWATYKKEPPARWANSPILERLREHTKNKDKQTRRMPDLEDIKLQ